MPNFNTIQDLDPSDKYTKELKSNEKKFKLLSVHQVLMTEHPGSLGKA